MRIEDLFPITKWDFERESVLKDLPMEDIQLLTAHKTERIYNKGEVIFWEDGFPVGIYWVIEGRVKKYKLDKNGHEQIIYVAHTGEILGYHGILSGDRNPDSAAALEKSKIAFVPKEDFLAAVKKSETFNMRLLKTLSHEFAVLINSITIQAQKSVRERLALQLIVLREKYKGEFETDAPIEINMSRDDLANLVGTARENLVRLLSEFKESEILETKGRKIIIRDVNKLIRIANYV